MPLSKRQIWILAIALAALVVISLFAAPGGNGLQSGSTYGRSPDGYGAWYGFMESRGVTIHRWQKPLGLLFRSGKPSKTPAIETFKPQDATDTEGRRLGAVGQFAATLNATSVSAAATSIPETPITLLQVSNGSPLSMAHSAWVEQGNVLVLLGVSAPATKAPFDSIIPSPVGVVSVQTSRRHPDRAPVNALLGDSFGSVVWQRTVGKGQVIFASTPHLAANAYQDRGNFEFLAKLVTAPGLPIWVDEYSHGYKDNDVVKEETSGNLLGYLAKTPIALVAMQAAVLLLVLIWGQNRRLGPAIALPTPVVDNSEAYIQAMAVVLRKAESSQFVVDTIRKAEQLAIQKALGLGTAPLPIATVLDAWTQQTGQPSATLDAALNPTKRPRRLDETELLRWLEAIQTVRRQLSGEKV